MKLLFVPVACWMLLPVPAEAPLVSVTENVMPLLPNMPMSGFVLVGIVEKLVMPTSEKMNEMPI